MLPAPPAEERFAASYHVDPDTGCWVWTAGKTGHGYAAFWPTSIQVRAYRWSYEHFVGPIPPGLVIDHECHNRDPHCNANDACPHRACVNPDHLAVKTGGANILAGKSAAAANAVKTHCDRGHELNGENLIVKPNGRRPAGKQWRECRACSNARRRAKRRGVPMDVYAPPVTP